jgi:hypothetical protein
MRIYKILIALILALVLFSTCDKNKQGPELLAKTGPDTTASIGDTVWLDASPSSGPEYQIKWSIHNQPGNDTITFSDSDSAFFIPTSNGTYQVELTLTSEDLFNSDYMDVFVTGSVIIKDITSNTRLKKISVTDEPDYIVIEELAVTAELIVELGVIIEFKETASMVVRDGGEIYADNASFIAADSTWKGIAIVTENNTFTHCLIENAGNASFTDDPDEKAAVIMKSGANLVFSGNTLKYSGGYGIIVKNGANFSEDTENQVYPFGNNHFIKNAQGPMVIPVHVLSDLSGQYFEEETEDTYIEIYESTYSSSISKAPWLSNQGMPYKITGAIQFDKDMTINKGVELYFESDAGMKVNGKLTVSGTSSDPVILDGFVSGTAAWKGIFVHNGQVDLDYCSLLDAGNAVYSGLDVKASLTVEKLLSMSNSTISGSGGTGLNMPGTAHIQYTENFKGNTFSNNKGSAVRIRMDDVNKVVNGNTITSSSGIPAIEVHMGLDDPLGTWVNLASDYDYKVLESLTIKATKDLTIEAGATIKMPVGTILQINGGLQAIGTTGSMVTIGGTESKKGHWDGIFLSGTQKVTLDYVNIMDGGGDFEDNANLIVQSAATDVTVTNSTINNSKGYGVLIKSGASGFGIYDPVSNNTLEGDWGGYHEESK